MKPTNTILDSREILRLLPHRYPFVLVDRVTAYDPGKSIVALKNVTINEPFFPGHFPDVPVMPGVLILEAMAQAAGLLAIMITGMRREDGWLLYFAGIDECRFKRQVVPGDQLVFEATVLRHKRDIWKFAVRATVDGELACEAEMMCALRNARAAAAAAEAAAAAAAGGAEPPGEGA